MSTEIVNGKKIYRCGSLTYTFGALLALFFWLLWGDFAWAMKDRGLGGAVTVMIRSLNVSDFTYSLIFAFPTFTNIFICPVVSYLSDRHRGRWGRRIPFLMFSTPFVVLGVIGIGFSPMLGQFIHGLIPGISAHMASLIWFCIFWVMLDFGTTLSMGLSNALINDVVPKELLGRLFALYRMVSLGAGIIFNYWLLGKVAAYYIWIFSGMGILYGLGLLSICLKVKEGEYPPPPPEKTGKEAAWTYRIFGAACNYFKQSFSIPYYRWLMLALMFSALSAVPFNNFALLYSNSIGVTDDAYGKVLALTYAISMIMTWPFGYLVDKFHPLRLTIVAQSLYFVTMLLGFFLVHDVNSFRAALLAHGVVSGMYFTVSASLSLRLFPKSLFAQFCSANALVFSAAITVFMPMMGKLFDLLDHQYQYLFLFGSILTFISVLLLLVIFGYYKKLGGDANYTPPEP